MKRIIETNSTKGSHKSFHRDILDQGRNDFRMRCANAVLPAQQNPVIECGKELERSGLGDVPSSRVIRVRQRLFYARNRYTIICNEHLKLARLITLQPTHNCTSFHHLHPPILIPFRIDERDVHHKSPDLSLLQDNPCIHASQPFHRKILLPYRSTCRHRVSM